MTALAPTIKITPNNQKTYQKLKQILSLELRRQILIAICDDLPVRDHLAAHLQAEFGYPPNMKNGAGLVSLRLNLKHPDPIAQILHWLNQHSLQNTSPAPIFQIVGIENLMREQPALQWTFLKNLREIDQNLPLLESNLIFWITRPWLRSIKDSAPEFWQWRTGFFELEGEPKPALISDSNPSKKTRPKTPKNTPKTPAKLPPIEPITQEKEAELSSFILNDLTLPPEIPPTETSDTQAPPLLPPQTKLNLIALDFTDLKSQSPQISELVELIIATATQELQAGETSQVETVIKNLEQIQTLSQQPVANQNDLAIIYQTLGDNYRFRIERNQVSPEYLMIAIRSYEQVLQLLTPDSPQTPNILNDIGNLYWMLSRYIPNPPEKLPYLDLAIHCYNAALLNLEPTQQPQTYALLQNNLGAVYGELSRYRHPPQNLQQSVLSYQEALRYRQPEPENLESPLTKQYAATLNNLGTAYWNLAQHQQPPNNLKQAITTYNQALEYYNPQQQPLDYGMLQNNLGTAYWNLAQYENPPENLSQAINAYEIALNYRTPENNPTGCAATQNNLATAYWHLANQNKNQFHQYTQSLEKAIHAYNIALILAEELTKLGQHNRLTFDPFAAHNNLGLTHYQLATHPQTTLEKDQRCHHLETALLHHLQALQGWQNQPDFQKTAFNFIIQTVRAFYTEAGIQGQNQALSKLPPQLLPEILTKL